MGEDVHQEEGDIHTLQTQGHSSQSNVGTKQLKEENKANHILRIKKPPPPEETLTADGPTPFK